MSADWIGKLADRACVALHIKRSVVCVGYFRIFKEWRVVALMFFGMRFGCLVIELQGIWCG